MTTYTTAETLIASVQKFAPLIREHAVQAEENRKLSQSVMSALAEAGVFRMYVPRSLGGLEVDPLTFSRVLEEIARIDGSTGWCAAIGGANPLFASGLSVEAAEEIFGKDPLMITGSTIFPEGKAIARDGGYVVSGRWPYASEKCHFVFSLLL